MLQLLLQLVLMLVVLVVSVAGDIVITQINLGSTESWVVRGIATYEYGGSDPDTFVFQCTSTINNGGGLSWSRLDAPLDLTQVILEGKGVELELVQPVPTNAGIYVCEDDDSDDISQFILTDYDPAAIAKTGSLTHYVGDTVTINMYVSTLMPLTDNFIAWKINNTDIVNGDFSNSKTTLTLSNVQLSDAGTYRIIITIGSGILTTSNSSNTVLHINELPSVINDPGHVTTLEWESTSLNCTGNGGNTVTWYKQNSNLPATNNISTTYSGSVVTSVLTITDLRSADSGEYYCNITTGNGERYATSSLATLTVLDNTRLSFAPNGGNVVLLSDRLLYVDVDVFNITCEGSGSLYWISPNTTNVSFVDTNNPYQYILPDNGFSRLEFTSFSSQYWGVYSCVSDEQYNIVYVTNDNPVIYTTNTEVIVGLTTDVTLKVYTDGANPIPSSNDITWTFKGSTITDNAYYSLQSGNTELVITNAPSNMTTGLYQSSVTTIQGTSSINITISYFDAPIVTVMPDSITSLEGETVSYNCTVHSYLTVTMAWYHGNGTLITSSDGLLTINNVTSNDRGVYYCEAADVEGIYTPRRMNVSLIVRYAPMVFISTAADTDPQQTVLVFLEETATVGTYFCSADGYPEPDITWMFNGGELPEGVSQNSNGQLIWERKLLYSDNGTFSCHASNNIGHAVANLFMNVHIIPKISTIYSTNREVSFTSVNPLTVRKSSSIVSLTCLGQGIPVPSLYWIDNNGNELNNAFISRPCGTVQYTLEWNQTLLPGPIHCIVANTFGNDTVTVQTDDNDEGMTNTGNDNSIMDPPTNRETLTIRIKLNTADCTDNLLSVIQGPLITAIQLTIIDSSQSCDISTLMIAVTHSTCISAQSTTDASVFVITVTTDTAAQTQDAYNAIGQWIGADPFILYDNQPYQVDSDCDFLVLASDQLSACSQPQPSSTSTTTISGTSTPGTTMADGLTAVWISIVGVILLLLLIVVVSLVLVLVLCIKSMGRKGGTRERTQAEAWPADQSNEVVSLATWRTVSTNVSSQEFSTSFRSNKLEQCNSQEDSNSAVMLDNPEYIMGSEIAHIRQTIGESMDDFKMPPVTPTDDQIDSPNGWDTDYNTGQSTAAINFTSHDSLRSTTPTPDQYRTEDPTYAIIRPNARIEERRVKPSLAYINDPNKPNHYHRRATLPSPVRVSPTKKVQSIHYTEPHSQPISSRNNSRTSSSPALHQPLPYSQPISSMGSLQNVGKMSYRSSQSMSPDRGSISSPPNGANRSGRITSPLNVVDETVAMQQHWYSADSDIVTPTFGDPIEPYATMLSSQIEANPYSQPDQRSTVSSSSPSTIRPTYLHTATVQYETINV